MKIKKIVHLLIIAILLISLGIILHNNQKKETIKIGVVLPMTGSSAIWGEYEEKGINLALEELETKNVEVIIEDSKSNNVDAVNAAQKLINIDDVDIIYTSLSGASNAIAPIASQSSKLHLYKAATIRPVLEFPDNSIKTGYYNYKEDCSILADLSIEEEYEKVAYVFAQADFSNECKESITERSAGRLELDDYPFEYSKEDFSTILTKIKKTNYDVIIITGYNSDFSKFYKKMLELGVKIPVLCAGAEDCLDKNEDIAPEGIIYFGADLDEEFKKKLLEKNPDSTLLEQSIASTTYDMINFVSEAYSECKNKDKRCLKNTIINSNIKTAQGSQGFNGNIINLKVGLFQLSSDKKIKIVG